MISDYGTSKVLAVNEIELGMTVPTIESRTSHIEKQKDKDATFSGSNDIVIRNA